MTTAEPQSAQQTTRTGRQHSGPRQPALRVEIWSDIACPFCYLGKARFEQALAAFPQRDSVEVVHRSFELDPSRAADDRVEVLDMLARKYGMSREQALANERRIAAQAAELGLGYRAEGRDSAGTFDMHRLLHFAAAQPDGAARQDALLSALYRANFAEEESLYGGTERLVALAEQAGLDPEAARAVLADPAAYAEEVRADEREAAALGVTGVPFFVLDRKYGISGAQPVEVFAQGLAQAWSERTPVLTPLNASDPEADACGPDGCAVPPRA